MTEMSTDNTSLEEMVEKTLESTGVLTKIRAELRANVFRVLEKGSSFQDTLNTSKIKEFVSNQNGLLLLSLVKDLFDYLELTFTASVFESETGAGLQYQYKDKNNICEELCLSREDKQPLLLQIIDTYPSHSKSKPRDDTDVKSFPTKHNDEISKESSSLAQLLKNNEESNKTFDIKSKSVSPVRTNVLESETLSCTNSELLSSSNFNLPNNEMLKDVDCSESSKSLSLGQLSPNKRITHVEQNDNTDDDVNSVKSDLKFNKTESSLEDIETDENVSCGNDSLASTDLSNQKNSPEMMIIPNIHL